MHRYTVTNEIKKNKTEHHHSFVFDCTSYSLVFIWHHLRSLSLIVLALWLTAGSVNLKRGPDPEGVLGVLQTMTKSISWRGEFWSQWEESKFYILHMDLDKLLFLNFFFTTAFSVEFMTFCLLSAGTFTMYFSNK